MKRKIKKHPVLVIFSEENYIDTSAFKGFYAFFAIEPNLLAFTEVLEKHLIKEIQELQPKKIIDYTGSETIAKVSSDLNIPMTYGN